MWCLYFSLQGGFFYQDLGFQEIGVASKRPLKKNFPPACKSGRRALRARLPASHRAGRRKGEVPSSVRNIFPIFLCV